MKLRDYQKKIAEKSIAIIKERGFVYLAMEVRTGKTLTSLSIAQALDKKSVLFITKKKAISSIDNDYNLLNPKFYLHTINYESLHKISKDLKFDMIVVDEAHSIGAFPKPSKRAVDVASLIYNNRADVILMSGTPTPESYSQIYHQVFGIRNNPFNGFRNFYGFARQYVNIKERMINSLRIRDYSEGYQSIMDAMKPYMIAYSQKEAGFKVVTNEKVLYVDMLQTTYNLAEELQRRLVIEGKDEIVLADTPVKLMMKLHQIYSGTVKFESGQSMVIDNSKAKFIRKFFHGMKIGIFYKFKAELEALKGVYGDALTTELSVFEDTDKNIALQIVSGREGISLKKASALVYYNIDFSATSYWQSRDRMTTKDRLENDVYWIFSRGGIEKKIYKAVTNKKDYTLSHFKKDLLSL
jgi:SNF2 family DNA or RNA helicase